MQLREILDLDAMLSKDPAPESLSDDDDGSAGEISEKNAGPSFKDEPEPEGEHSLQRLRRGVGPRCGGAVRCDGRGPHGGLSLSLGAAPRLHS